ncbi:[Pyruvate dehydrogenase (acetyl-transferring)] kinase 1, mitochondrial [Diutina catenulata]
MPTTIAPHKLRGAGSFASRITWTRSFVAVPPTRYPKLDQQKYLEEYRIRSLLESPIRYYADRAVPPFRMSTFYSGSAKASPEFLLQSASETVESLLSYTGRRLRTFRRLPYLVVLNPAIAESYELYLETLSMLIRADKELPRTQEQNEEFVSSTLNAFVEMHADSLPQLSKGFNEVMNAGLMTEDEVRTFLDNHLRARIKMRLLAQQHIVLTERVKEGKVIPGSNYNGVIQPLSVVELVKKNAEYVNDLFFVKYDAYIPFDIKTITHPGAEPGSSEVVFPYVDFHFDYILTELFKNAFRAHVENKIDEPVQIIISAKGSEFLEMRIRDRGHGINSRLLEHIFDYSFTTVDDSNASDDGTYMATPGGDDNLVAGMGYGLPLSKNYVEIFNEPGDPEVNGSLTLQTYPGFGTDLYLKMRGK